MTSIWHRVLTVLASLRPTVSRVTTAVLVFVLWCGLSFVTVAQTTDQEHRAVVEAVAKYHAFATDGLDQRLRDLGYVPPADDTVWAAFPAVRKIEAAFVAAEEAAPGGGQRFLALLARALAQEYEAIRYEPALATYFDDGPIRAVAFANIGWDGIADGTLGVVERQAIAVVAKYAEGSGPLGGIQGVLSTHFDLTGDRAYEILRSSRSPAEALERGYLEIAASRSEANARMSLLRLIDEVQVVYPAALSEPAFESHRRSCAELLASLFEAIQQSLDAK